MNTSMQSTGVTRTLVLMIAAGALTFSACGTVTEPPAAGTAVEETPRWSYSPYPHRVDSTPDASPDGRSTWAPRAMGRDVPVPAV